MPHQTYSRTGQRYIADSKSKLVHDLDQETPDCNINESLQTKKAVSFIPDQLRQAMKEGYQPCPKCLPEEARQYEAEQKQQPPKVQAPKEKPKKEAGAAAQ